MIDTRTKTEPPTRPGFKGLLPTVMAGFILVVAIGLVIGAALSSTPQSQEPLVAGVASPRAVVLKSKRLLHLFDGDELIRTYPIDLGIAPVGPKFRKADGKTPEGSFRVASKNPESQYHRFIGIDYPDLQTSNWGLSKGLISPGEWASLQSAHASGRCPDWSTALGGGIGIHGHRKGTDWTGGCVAVSDEAIEELFNVLRIGDPIEILP